MLKHPLGLWKSDDRLATHCLKMVDLFDTPAFGFGIEAGSFFMVLRAFAFGLIFGGDPDPDADGFSVTSVHLLPFNNHLQDILTEAAKNKIEI
jgi:hypothetical protein